MIPLSFDPPVAIFTRFVYDWFRLLTYGQVIEAAAELDEPTSYGERWSARSIQSALDNYSPGVKVTDPKNLPADPYLSLVAFADGSGYSFDCSVPIAGEWSDLTAQFEFLHRPNGFAVVLEDLHVL